MKMYIGLFIISLGSSAQALLSGPISAASNIVHGATDVATGTTKRVLSTPGTIVGSEDRYNSTRPYRDEVVDEDVLVDDEDGVVDEEIVEETSPDSEQRSYTDY
ncbi:hypothetical protein H0X06_05590 [Candidatus Dependentiae bacterium]|nr:hypothetical protein [Candidatus Dependentiae bacterium]